VDYKLNSKIDGTGADLTANLTVTTGLSGNATSFELSTTVAGFVVVLQQRGKPLYDYGGAVLRWEDKVSIAQYGVASQQIDMPYTADPHLALEVAQFTVYNGAFPLTNLSGFKRIVDFKNTPEVSRSIARQISDRITISDPVTGVARPFFINAIDELVGDNRIETEWLLVAADITGYWLLEVPGYTELDLTTRLAFGQIIGHTDLPHQDIHGDQVHYDVIHQDTHTDNIHVDVTHVDYVTHTDDASHQDTWNHDDVTHQDVAHSDGAHTDIAQVYWHTDVPHSDVAHQDYHQDYPHQDAPHNDVHDDVWRQTPGIDFHDHTDCRTVFSAHNDGITHYYHDHLDCMSVWYSGYSPPPSGAVHSDWNFYDSVSHYPNGPHDDYNRDTFVEHEDFHGDTHADTHNDQAHGDYTEYVVHQDNPTQWAHGDSPHTDVPHYDTTHVDVAHVDNWPHTDAATHADSAIHSDIAHTDIAHGDIAHEDIAHSDSPHQDSHADFHGDIN
jgi:hypothetical protein